MPGALEADLSPRFAREYRVLAMGSPAAAAVLRDLAGSSDDVAVVIASDELTGSSGVDFLVAAHELHPGPRRVLLIDRGDFGSAHPAARAMTLGLIDHHLFGGDVTYVSTKRVASAVGVGATAIQLVHAYLQEGAHEAGPAAR